MTIYTVVCLGIVICLFIFGISIFLPDFREIHGLRQVIYLLLMIIFTIVVMFLTIKLM